MELNIICINKKVLTWLFWHRAFTNAILKTSNANYYTALARLIDVDYICDASSSMIDRLIENSTGEILRKQSKVSKW